MARKKNIWIRQHDMKDCGAACLAMILKYYGYNALISKLRERMGTDNEGTTIYGIKKAAKELNLITRSVKLDTYEELINKFNYPVIAHVIIDKRIKHYVVIQEVTKDRIIISDPAKGIKKYTPEEFCKIWTNIIILMVPDKDFEPKNEFKGLSKPFINTILSQKKIVSFTIIASLMVTALGIGGSLYYKYLIDNIIPSNSINNLVVLVLFMIVLYIFKIGLDFIRNILMLKIAKNIDISIFLNYYKHVVNLPLNFFKNRQIGEIISRFYDANRIREALSSATLTLIIDSIMAVAGAIILYNQSSQLFFISYIPIILYLLLGVIFKKPIESGNQSCMQSNGNFTSYLIESLEGIEVVKAYNREEKVYSETKSRFKGYIENNYKYSLLINLQSVIKSAIENIFNISLIGVGALLVLQGRISIGVLLSFIALLEYYIGPIERIINLQATIQGAMVAANRLVEVLELEIEKSDNLEKRINLDSIKGNIKFENVKFRYGARRLVLSDINIDIKQGEKVAFVGASGSGKTTISKLIMNFYNIENGNIYIDGININNIKKESLRERIGYIAQDSFFFSGTIYENLMFANPNATYEDIVEACKIAQLHTFIMSLPFGYNTIIEENGTNLSGGQKQRLSIARAIVRKPDVLVMDEATSSLDSITEKAIEATMNNYTKNITTIIIAHRLSTILSCDRIYVLDKGAIIENGSHNELLLQKGVYYKMWSKQADILICDENVC